MNKPEPIRMRPVDEYLAAIIAHDRQPERRLSVLALNHDGYVMNVEPVFLADTQRMAADVYQMVEQAVHDGASIASLVFIWCHDDLSVSVVTVTPTGDATQQDYITHPVDVLHVVGGLQQGSIWCLASAAVTTTAFRFATIGSTE